MKRHWLAGLLCSPTLAGLVLAGPSPAARAADAAPAAAIIVWDGEKEGGAAWAMPEANKSTLKPQTETVHAGMGALAFSGEGKDWTSCGWNWHGWWPKNAGTDISQYANLVFWLKSGGAAPDTLKVCLTSNNRKPTLQVSITAFCANVADGTWHEVVIPLRALYGDHTEFDPKNAWEIAIHTYSAESRKLAFFLDDIGFDNRDVEK